jgi:N-acetylmuramoyl-L-alanine amidase
MATATIWATQARPATMAYAHRGVFSEGFVRDGDRLLASPDSLARLGWSVRPADGEADIEAEGRRVRVVMRGGLVPVNDVADQLGAVAEWEGDRLALRGMVRVIEVGANGVRVDLTLGVRPRAFALADPERLVIDLEGAALAPKARFTLPAGVRVGQFEPNVVRLVIERPGAGRMVRPIVEGRRIAIDFPGLMAAPTTTPTPGLPAFSALDPPPQEPEAQIPPDQDPASYAPPLSSQELPPIAEPPGTQGATTVAPNLDPPVLTGLQVSGDAAGATLRLRYRGTLVTRPTAVYVDTTTVELSLSGFVGSRIAIPGELPASITALAWRASGGLRMGVSLGAPLVFQLAPSRGEIILRFSRPPRADGRLAGKTVVVDAGHGGPDSGAVSTDGRTMEKTLALRNALALARELTEQGANVILTRSDDSRVPLRERSAIANRAGADFFISVHFNSNRLANSATGSKSFFHGQDPAGRLLAQCIQAELPKSSRIPSLGIWSDTRIYASGFAVLREATMPAVLLELGFINHWFDVQEANAPGFAERTAQAVVRGLKVYLGDGSSR